MTQAASLAALGSTGISTGFKNRIINGDMRIDQRNAGGALAITTYAQYPVDRWQSWHFLGSGFYSLQQKSDGSPVGMHYLRTTTTTQTSLSAGQATSLRYVFEGVSLADLNWGTSSAVPATLSFWVRSSLTGTWQGSVRSVVITSNYNFQYTITAANTWQKVVVPITPPTTQGASAFPVTNVASLDITLTLGGTGSASSTTQYAWTTDPSLTTAQTNMFATNGSTLDMTGFQFEVGSTATTFDFRSIDTEIRMCQRYYETGFPYGVAVADNTNYSYWSGGGLGATAYAANNLRTVNVQFVTPKRSTPSVTLYKVNNIGSANYWIYYGGSGWANYSDGTNAQATPVNFNVRSTQTSSVGVAYMIDGQWAASAEI